MINLGQTHFEEEAEEPQLIQLTISAMFLAAEEEEAGADLAVFSKSSLVVQVRRVRKREEPVARTCVSLWKFH
jgi:hypothetical protein